MAPESQPDGTPLCSLELEGIVSREWFIYFSPNSKDCLSLAMETVWNGLSESAEDSPGLGASQGEKNALELTKSAGFYTVAPPSPDCWRFLAHRQARSIMHRLFSPGASSPGVQNRVGLLNFHNILHCRESPGLQHRLGALNQKVRLLRTGLRSRDREEEGCLENWVWVTCWFYSHGVQRPAQERALSW